MVAMVRKHLCYYEVPICDPQFQPPGLCLLFITGPRDGNETTALDRESPIASRTSAMPHSSSPISRCGLHCRHARSKIPGGRPKRWKIRVATRFSGLLIQTRGVVLITGVSYVYDILDFVPAFRMQSIFALVYSQARHRISSKETAHSLQSRRRAI